ncbi:aminopyrimidine aminohydrolase [Lactobacillus nasalidis]|uniref:Aminopyrimidine aminohydrolase n=1 Tax=Lactobacillus nasalidis TaxID=2797258 RepID=A0ABQ3W7C2_9LACO|nr:TenA family protein [Lactobacillus nasalidis]GHV97204.1 aminopyrimidine aminohydrolase [Lactobacillus nasalidis]GHV99025.1 aminopyrimidine aminohydrolase [Lactobacillus nasalidis]GHW01669.1 aminopyrimidine aminohydrolase [Lactobacillus nasalidis]
MNEAKTNKFSDQLHQAAAPLWQKSLHHPFITELASGQLPLTTFRYYLTQDTKYLEAFNQLHEKTAALLPSSQGELLLRLAREAGEDVQHNPILLQVDLTAGQIRQAPIAPNNYAYITHMEHQLSLSPAAAVAGLLPCYWLYDELADYWKGQTSPIPVYQAFFNSYQTAGFNNSTRLLIGLVDDLAAENSDLVKEQMLTAFMRSSRYELGFWQMAYTHQTWDDLEN